MDVDRGKDSQSVARQSLLWLGTAGLYLLLSASTILITSEGGSIATVWPANAVLVALLIIGPSPRWAWVLSAGLAGNLVANWLTRGTVAGPLLYSLANGIEVVIAVSLLRTKAGGMSLLSSTSLLVHFIYAAGIVAPTISGLLGSATAALVYQQSFSKAFATWVLSDSLGLLVFTPVFRSLFDGAYLRCFASRTARQRIEAIGLFGVTLAMTYAVFFIAALPALFLLYAPVMMVTFRVGPLGTKTAVMMIAITGALATATGNGPLAPLESDATSQAHLFQVFLAVMLFTCLPVAAEVAERNRLTEELRAREREAFSMAMTDPLTDVLNRRGLERSIGMLVTRPATPLACVILDIDRFKGINDRWGHKFGDDVLRHLAAVLRSKVRPDDLIARLGGDEFVLVLKSDAAGARAVCARIQSALRENPLSPDGKIEVMVAISVGIDAIRPSEPFDDACKRADEKLYSAKAAGRNTYRSA